jgi:hypothetical protein
MYHSLYYPGAQPFDTPLSIGVGDILKRPKGLFMHQGVCIGVDWLDVRVLHVTPGQGILLSSYAEFADGKTVTVAKKAQRSEIPAIIARAQTELEQPSAYDPLTNNCEHLVNRVVLGVSKSVTVELLIAIIIALVVIAGFVALSA